MKSKTKPFFFLHLLRPPFPLEKTSKSVNVNNLIKQFDPLHFVWPHLQLCLTSLITVCCAPKVQFLDKCPINRIGGDCQNSYQKHFTQPFEAPAAPSFMLILSKSILSLQCKTPVSHNATNQRHACSFDMQKPPEPVNVGPCVPTISTLWTRRQTGTDALSAVTQARINQMSRQIALWQILNGLPRVERLSCRQQNKGKKKHSGA